MATELAPEAQGSDPALDPIFQLSAEHRVGVLQQAEDAVVRSHWMVAIMALVTLLSLGALITNIWMARPTPILVEVDRSSGDVRVLSDLIADERVQRITADEAVIHHEIVEYVRTREGWLDATFDQQWPYVQARSTALVYDQYEAPFEDPASSPRVLYADHVRRVEVLSISPLAERLAHVRLRVSLHQAIDDALVDERLFVVLIGWDFLTERSADLLRRWDNPLQFVVTKYERDEAVE